MLKNLTRLEHIVNEKVYEFVVPFDAPLPEAKEALCQFLKIAMQIEEAAKAVQASSPQSPVPDDQLRAEGSTECPQP